jgi:hypothetical protein
MAGENWPVTINQSAAYQSLHNLAASNYSSNATQPWNYTDITNMTNASLTNSSQTATAIFSPFNSYYLGNFGYYIYVSIIVVIAVVALAKGMGLFRVGIAVSLMSALVISQATSNAVPNEILMLFYMIAGLGFFASVVGYTKER